MREASNRRHRSARRGATWRDAGRSVGRLTSQGKLTSASVTRSSSLSNGAAAAFSTVIDDSIRDEVRARFVRLLQSSQVSPTWNTGKEEPIAREHQTNRAYAIQKDKWVEDKTMEKLEKSTVDFEGCSRDDFRQFTSARNWKREGSDS